MPVSQDHGAGQMKLCMEYSSIMLCSELSTQRLEEATAIITFLSSCVSCRIRSGTVPHWCRLLSKLPHVLISRDPTGVPLGEGKWALRLVVTASPG